MSIEDIYREIQRQKQSSRESARDIMQPSPRSGLDLVSNIMSSYGSNPKSEEEGLIKADRLMSRLDSTFSRLLIDPLSGDKKIYNNTEIDGILKVGREEADKFINMSPESTQYIESAYQRWNESLSKRKDDNLKMYVIKNRFNQMHDDGGQIDEIEEIFKGLYEGDMSTPYIKVGKDGKMSRTDAFSKIAKITNYMKENKDFLEGMQDHPYFSEIDDMYVKANALSSFFTAQLLGLNENSDVPLLTSGELDALNKYSIDGDVQPLINLAASMNTQVDKYEQAVETNMTSTLSDYNKWNEMLNNQPPEIMEAIDNFNPKNFNNENDRITALKNIMLETGEKDEYGNPKEISLYDVQERVDSNIKSIIALDKEYSSYNLEGKSFSQSPEGVKYRDIFESLDIKSPTRAIIPSKKITPQPVQDDETLADEEYDKAAFRKKWALTPEEKEEQARIKSQKIDKETTRGIYKGLDDEDTMSIASALYNPDTAITDKAAKAIIKRYSDINLGLKDVLKGLDKTANQGLDLGIQIFVKKEGELLKDKNPLLYSIFKNASQEQINRYYKDSGLTSSFTRGSQMDVPDDFWKSPYMPKTEEEWQRFKDRVGSDDTILDLKSDADKVKQQGEIVSKVMDLSPSKAVPNRPNKEELDAIINEYDLSKTQKSLLMNMYVNKGNEKRFNKIESKFIDSVNTPIAEKRVERLVDRAVSGTLSKKDEALLSGLDKQMLDSFENEVNRYKKRPKSQSRYLKGLAVREKLIDAIKESL